MINPRETLQEALDKKGEDIHPGILARFFVEETAFSYSIVGSIKILGKEQRYNCRHIVSKELFQEARSKKELMGSVDFVVDAIVRRIRIGVQRV